MLTSATPVVYATDATWEVWRQVARWRGEGLEAYCTLDAGPNPHVIVRSDEAGELEMLLASIPEVGRIWRSEVHTRGAHVVERSFTEPAEDRDRRRRRRECVAGP